MKSYLLIGALLVGLVVFGVWWTHNATSAIVPAPEPTAHNAWSTYATSTFSINYPSDYTLNTAYTYDIALGRTSQGVAFVIPASLAEGTNLAGDSYISVEWIPELSSCHAAQYSMESPVSGGPNVTDDGVEYSFATSTGAAAGNLYEETVYVRQDRGPCLAVRYFIHSGNIGNYPEGTVAEFDRNALVAEFDQIRRSLERK